MPRPAGHALNQEAWDWLVERELTSITEVAEASDTPRSTLSGLVGGHHGASVPQAKRIAEALGCPPSILFPSLAPKPRKRLTKVPA